MSVFDNDTHALLTGALMGQLMKMCGEYGQTGFGIAITSVEPDYDDAGNYLNTIKVQFQSGHRLIVRVDSDEQIIHEEA